MFKVPEKRRVTEGKMKSSESDGNNGVFHIIFGPMSFAYCIASDGMGWEHVSVTVHDRGKTITPTWDQMCRIKDMFWDDTDTVIQYHPSKEDYVNRHPNCLHLWRPIKLKLPKPLKIMVG